MVGSTESDLIWKVKATPLKASIFRLAPSTRRTSDKDFIGWRTPNTRDGMQSGYEDMEKLANRWERGKQVQLCDQVKMVTSSVRSTPTVNDAKNTAGPSQFKRNSQALNVQAAGGREAGRVWDRDQAIWPTPRAVDGDKGQRTPDGCKAEIARKGRLDDLPSTAVHSGTTPSGSTDPTEKRGALNPEFVCWLMGFPPEWESCAPTAMPSSRRLRQK